MGFGLGPIAVENFGGGDFIGIGVEHFGAAVGPGRAFFAGGHGPDVFIADAVVGVAPARVKPICKNLRAMSVPTKSSAFK